MIVSATEMLKKAVEGKYVVGQFNINNLEWTKAILLTAQENNSPVILGVSEGAGKYMTGFKTVAAMVKAMVEELNITVPVALRPLGASVYAPAVDTIHDADEQFGRLLWEYEGGQLAIDVDAAALRPTGDGGFQMDQRSGRLYRGCMTGNVADRTLFNVFAPALRDEAYLRGLDGILKRIEFQCGLAYGTLSDPQNVDKTATEIMASKQRSYSTVKSIQHALQVALDDLLYAMNAYADLYQLAPAGSYTAVYNWDDSIVNDPSERKQLFWQYVQAGKFPMQRYLTEFEGYSQEEAAQIAAETSAENTADEALTFAP